MQKKSCLVVGIAAVGIVVLAAVVIGIMVSGTYNRLVKLDEDVNKAWAQVENVLQRRYDLIPNLVNTVKGFAKQEEKVLTEVTRLRSQWGQAQSIGEKAQTATALEGALGRLMVVLERYPELKSDRNFLALQDELAGTENRVAVERQRYNETLQQYNTAVRSFPANLLSGMMGFQRRDTYFKAEEGAATAPKVEF